MTWIGAISTGFSLGLISFGALWMTVRQLMCGRQRRIWVVSCGLVRLLVVGVVFYALSRDGADKILAGLAGLWLARWCLVLRLGGIRHGR